METKINTREITCMNIRLNYIDEGRGECLLFLHNGGGFWQIWTKQIEEFRNTHRVIALDFPGFGDSDESKEAYTLDYFTTILHCFLDKLEIHKVSLVGNCIGASISLRFNQLFPEKTDKLILMNICPGERLIRLKIFRYLLFSYKSKRFHHFFSALLKFFVTKTPVKNTFPKILFSKHPDKQSPLYKKYIHKMKEAKQNRSRLKLLYASNSYSLHRFIKPDTKVQKSLLMWGSENKVAPLKREGCYHRELCGIPELYSIDRAGHLLMYEASENCNSLIRKHLSA
jgi:pimeloyl-ACP methyl ester carboxylesterase